MVKIRPHHIFCTLAYEGKGYSKDFILNMDKIVEKLKQEDAVCEIVFGNDDICKKCPYNTQNICKFKIKVEKMDNIMIKEFNLKEEKINYLYLKKKILEMKNLNKIEQVCKNCEWEKDCMCIEKINNII